MDITQRIAQFEKMAHDDPGNDMAHFSLGQAYHQAGRFAEAAASFRRCACAGRFDQLLIRLSSAIRSRESMRSSSVMSARAGLPSGKASL